MANTSVTAVDGGGVTRLFSSQTNPDATLTFYHVEDPVQRATILAKFDVLSANSVTVATNIGTPADAAVVLPGSPASLVEATKGVLTLLTRGAAVTANALPVTIASDQANIPTASKLAVPDTVVTGASLDATSITSLFLVTPNGNSSVRLKVGTPGVAFPGGAILVFEAVRIPGAAASPANVFPGATTSYTPNSGRVKSTAVGGEFTFASEGATSVQVRVGTAGTAGAIPITAQVALPPTVQPVVPVNIGQTTRAYDRPNKQRLVTSATDAVAIAIAASEVMLHARGSAIWFDINTPAIAASAPFCLESGERIHIQIFPGDVIHAIQDTAAGVLVITPVA